MRKGRMESEATILVVDDEESLLEALRETLETHGFEVLTATDGAKALALLRSEPVDLILADVAMPNMNGYQFYERVRENPRWTSIPFIFLTARAMDSDVRYGKELGVDDYLTKPVEMADMLATIRGKLRRAEQLTRRAALLGEDGTELRVGRLRIKPRQHRVWMGDELIQLSAREFKLLERMARRAPQVVPPTELVQVTHGLETDRVEAGTLIRPLIRSLRRKLGYSVGDMGCIENVRGVGYRLLPPGEE